MQSSLCLISQQDNKDKQWNKQDIMKRHKGDTE
jgi:hypothetical protein